MTTHVSIVTATRNSGKIKEIHELLKGCPVRILNLTDFGPLPEVVEDGKTFEENAYKKAGQTARMLGCPALADDSGLVVKALGGAPGVHSARFGGENASDKERYHLLLDKLKGQTNRNAFFSCVISFAVPSGPALTFEGRCDGLITTTPIGHGGFGYDPVFFYPPLNKTFAQMTRREKAGISHRGKALSEFTNEIEKVIKWLYIHMPVQPKTGCKKDSVAGG